LTLLPVSANTQRKRSRPRWTPENRPVVDGSNPASGERPKHECSTPVVRKNARPSRDEGGLKVAGQGGCQYGSPRDRGSCGLYGARLRPVDASRRERLAAVKPGAPGCSCWRRDHSPPAASTSWVASTSLAGFQVSTTGRF
jgi:hypothetical protein